MKFEPPFMKKEMEESESRLWDLLSKPSAPMPTVVGKKRRREVLQARRRMDELDEYREEKLEESRRIAASHRPSEEKLGCPTCEKKKLGKHPVQSIDPRKGWYCSKKCYEMRSKAQ